MGEHIATTRQIPRFCKRTTARTTTACGAILIPAADTPTPRNSPWSWITQPRTVITMGILIILLLGAVIGLATALALQRNSTNGGSSTSPTSSDTCSSPSSGPCTTETATVATTGLDLAITDVSNGCNDPNEKISGTTYRTQYPAFKRVAFSRHCNRELRPRPVFGMLVHDFDACMDACAIWSR
ncbi:hypothetical protein VTJ83DRAFT_7031, partial [Remersonia thermophila]